MSALAEFDLKDMEAQYESNIRTIDQIQSFFKQNLEMAEELRKKLARLQDDNNAIMRALLARNKSAIPQTQP